MLCAQDDESMSISPTTPGLLSHQCFAAELAIAHVMTAPLLLIDWMYFCIMESNGPRRRGLPSVCLAIVLDGVTPASLPHPIDSRISF